MNMSDIRHKLHTGKIGDTRTVPFLLKARRHGDEIIKKHASETIALLGESAMKTC